MRRAADLQGAALLASRGLAWELIARPRWPHRNRFRYTRVTGTFWWSDQVIPIGKSALDTAWHRLITEAMRVGVIAEADRFSLHGLKHRGITDSKDKASGGHRTERMRQRYDHETPLVEPAELPAFSGGFSGVNKKGA